MKLAETSASLIFVIAGKDFLVGESAVLDWQQGAVYVRIQFVQVYIETDDVLLTEPAGHESINVLRPFLYFRLSPDR